MTLEKNHTLYTYGFAALALIAFAANSVLCRLALKSYSIDPDSFTAIRLASGFLFLWLFISIKSGNKSRGGSWGGALMLAVYAAAFSYAYTELETGTGALILFASVQLTMIFASLFEGERIFRMELAGLITAFAGFIYLIYPGVESPSIFGFMYMCAAGVAWGMYTMIGRGSKDAIADTFGNFKRALVVAIGFIILAGVRDHYQYIEWSGVLLAVLSGALASGLGYALWYLALPKLRALEAGVMQLLVPIIAAVGGVAFSHETLTFRFYLSSLLILGGVALVLFAKRQVSGRETN